MNNRDLLLAVCREIQPLLDRLLLVGGCVTELLVTDQAAVKPRTTLDVDWVVNAVSLVDYYSLEDQLRGLGFSQAGDDNGVICRWTKNGLLLDIMPTDEKILGFGNRWYLPAISHAEQINLQDMRVQHISAPYFVAVKLEAFDSRGGGDYMMSHDLEDLIAVIDGRNNLLAEMSAAPSSLQAYIAARFSALLADDRFDEALPGHLPPDYAGQARLGQLLQKLTALSQLL